MNFEEWCHSRGISHFQASCIAHEFIRRFMYFGDKPFNIIEYENMLYPQYMESFRTISLETWEWLRNEARKRLSKLDSSFSKEVVNHWKKIANGEVPFGYVVKGVNT